MIIDGEEVQVNMIEMDGSAKSFLVVMGLVYAGLMQDHIKADLVSQMVEHNLKPEYLVEMYNALGEIIASAGINDKSKMN